MVDLRTFVSRTLIEIMDGVRDAQEALAGKSGLINPKMHSQTIKGPEYSMVYGPYMATTVEYDVAVEVAEKEGTGAGIGVVLGAINLGAGGKSDKAETAAHRIRFKIPVGLPAKEG